MKLHNLIFVGMIAGFLVGYGLYAAHSPTAATAAPWWHATSIWTLNLLGQTLFLSALKMIIAPLIFASIVAGVTTLPDLRELGAIGWKTIVYYALTTTIAVSIGLAAVLMIQPGKSTAGQAEREKRVAALQELRDSYQRDTGQQAVDADGRVRPEYRAWIAETESGRVGDGGKFAMMQQNQGRTAGDIFRDDILKKMLMNPFASLAEMNALGIIFFALLLGIACSFVGPPAEHVVAFFQGLNEVIMQITHWLMAVSPVAIACIVAELVATTGPEVFESLGWYCLTVIGGILVHVLVLLAICKLIGGVGPLQLWNGLREAWMIAFTTRSSSATLPVTIENVTENLDVSPKVANFTLPLGATMNMDGTALYEGVAVIFLIQIYGGLEDVPFVLDAGTTLVIFVTAVLASVGAAAVPNAGLVTMVLVAGAVGLPIYYIPFIFAVDAFLDMFRTSTNVLGDSVGAIVVNRLEAGRLGEPQTQPD